jgi:hypothetical protein
MDTKLTLKLDKLIIENAKKYASSKKRSLSRLIETYLKTLINSDKSISTEDDEISPFVKSMRSGVEIPSNLDYKKEYSEHLIKKHQ